MYGVECHNIQHEGGVSKKNIKDTVGDTSRTKILKFGKYEKKLRRLVTKQFAHDFRSLIKGWSRYFRQTLNGLRYFSKPISVRHKPYCVRPDLLDNNDSTLRHLTFN